MAAGASLAKVGCCSTAKLLLPLLTVNKKMKSRKKIYPPSRRLVLRLRKTRKKRLNKLE